MSPAARADYQWSRARRSGGRRPTRAPDARPQRRERATPPDDKFGANGNWRRWAPVINVRRRNQGAVRLLSISKTNQIYVRTSKGTELEDIMQNGNGKCDRALYVVVGYRLFSSKVRVGFKLGRYMSSYSDICVLLTILPHTITDRTIIVKGAVCDNSFDSLIVCIRI